MTPELPPGPVSPFPPVSGAAAPSSLGALLASPLIAVLEADMLAAQTSARFLHEAGFEAGETGPQLRTFTFQHGLEHGLGASDGVPGRGGTPQHEVSIPTLSMLAFPALQVHAATFTFAVQLQPSPPVSLDSTHDVLRPEMLARSVREEASAGLPRLGHAAPPPHGAPGRVLASAGVGAAVPTPAPGRAPYHARMAGAKRVPGQIQVTLQVGPADLPSGVSALLSVAREQVRHRRLSPLPNE